MMDESVQSWKSVRLEASFAYMPTLVLVLVLVLVVLEAIAMMCGDDEDEDEGRVVLLGMLLL
jgi:hypothetical protein